jgi:tRNA (guanine-N7-)-methyltransferase
MRSGSPRQISHGRHTKWQTAGVLAEPEALTSAGGVRALFDSDGPVELEIGCGKGTFLLARAAARKDVNFIGVERAKAYCLYAADRARRAGLANVRLFATDAVALVRQIADESLLRVHVYFPDPWPKRKHRLRRTLSAPFLRDLRRVLLPGGQLLIVTDHLDYFAHIRQAVRYIGGLVPVAFPSMSDASGELVGTNFERKYIVQGRPFYALALLKRGTCRNDDVSS